MLKFLLIKRSKLFWVGVMEMILEHQDIYANLQVATLLFWDTIGESHSNIEIYISNEIENDDSNLTLERNALEESLFQKLSEESKFALLYGKYPWMYTIDAELSQKLLGSLYYTLEKESVIMPLYNKEIPLLGMPDNYNKEEEKPTSSNFWEFIEGLGNGFDGLGSQVKDSTFLVLENINTHKKTLVLVGLSATICYILPTKFLLSAFASKFVLGKIAENPEIIENHIPEWISKPSKSFYKKLENCSFGIFISMATAPIIKKASDNKSDFVLKPVLEKVTTNFVGAFFSSILSSTGRALFAEKIDDGTEETGVMDELSDAVNLATKFGSKKVIRESVKLGSEIIPEGLQLPKMAVGITSGVASSYCVKKGNEYLFDAEDLSLLDAELALQALFPSAVKESIKLVLGKENVYTPIVASFGAICTKEIFQGMSRKIKGSPQQLPSIEVPSKELNASISS